MYDEKKDERNLRFQWNADIYKGEYTENTQVNTRRFNPAICLIAYKIAPNPIFPAK